MRAERAARVRQVAIAAGGLAMLIGGGHVAAWIVGVRPAHPAATIFMKTNAGLGLVLCGLALVLLARPAPSPVRRRLAAACGAAALLLGAMTFGEHLFGWDLGIDQLLAREEPGAAATVSPNRMGLPASLSCILLGVSLLLLARPRGIGRHRAWHQPWALIVALLGLLSIIGYLYGVSALYQIARVTAVAWPTALSLLLLAVGILCAAPEDGLMARMTADDPGGAIVRALLAPMVLLPLLFGWVRLIGERRHWFDAAMGTGLMMLLFMVIFSSLLLFASRRVSASSAAQRESERETRSQKDLLAVTLASIGDAVIVTDGAGAVTFLNGEAERLTGWADGEARGRALPDVFAIINEETRQVVENPVDKVMRLGQVVGLGNHTLLIARDGRQIPIDDSGAPIRQADGDVRGVVLVFRDITERKNAEQSLQRERSLLGSVMDATDVMLVYVDRDFNFVWVNAAYAETCRMRPEEMVGRNHFALYPDAENERIFRHVRDTGEPVYFRDRPFTFPDQPKRGITYWDWSLVPVKHDEGTVAGLVFSLRETTKYKRAEDTVHQNQERLRRLVQASAEAIGQTTREGVLQAVADAARDLTDARNVSVGHSFENGQFQIGAASRAADAPACPEGQAFLMEKGGVYQPLLDGADAIRMTDEVMQSHPAWWGLPDGHVPMRGLLGVRLVAANGTTSGTILVTDKREGDFSAEDEHTLRELGAIASLSLQQAQARQALEQADHRKNEFLALLSHELRNPLAAIRSAIYILERVPAGGERASRATTVVDRQAAQLARLVDDLLDVTRISRGKIQLQLEPVDLAGLVRRTAEDHRSLFATSGIDLDVHAGEEPLWVEGDAHRLAQAVGNLLHNAAKFTVRGGRGAIEVARDDAGNMGTITVSDTGEGISRDVLAHLFEPFMQADRTIDRARGGLGLGLALVKSLVDMHGGSVSARSDGIGRGAQFTIRLPLAAAPAVHPTTQSGASYRPRRVLIIEDNVDAADSLRVALQLGGHTVEVAYDGAEGIEMALRFGPDIVLCDIGLPGMNGYEVAQALRKDRQLAAVFLVALTGYAQPEDVRKAREAGFDVHVAKPPSPEKLQEIFAAPSAGGRSLPS